jgi:multiple sugar transport system permease protein
MAKSVKIKANDVIIISVMTILALIAFAPFYWSILISFRPAAEIYKVPASWLPTTVTLEHYADIFKNVPIARYFANTLFLTIINIFTNLLFGSMAAYGFAKIRFKLNSIIFRTMMFSMMLPGIVTLVPTFLLLRSVPFAGGNNIFGRGGTGLLGTYLGVLLPGTVGTYGIFFLRQFFIPISSEYAEAARIDGAGEFRIYSTIYVPMIIPAILTLAIFCFQGSWNSFIWPNLVLQGYPEKSVLTMALRSYSINTNYRYGPMMAMSIIMSLPIIIFFCFTQKYFISGITIGGIKG